MAEADPTDDPFKALHRPNAPTIAAAPTEAISTTVTINDVFGALDDLHGFLSTHIGLLEAMDGIVMESMPDIIGARSTLYEVKAKDRILALSEIAQAGMKNARKIIDATIGALPPEKPSRPIATWPEGISPRAFAYAFDQFERMRAATERAVGDEATDAAADRTTIAFRGMVQAPTRDIATLKRKVEAIRDEAVRFDSDEISSLDAILDDLDRIEQLSLSQAQEG